MVIDCAASWQERWELLQKYVLWVVVVDFPGSQHWPAGRTRHSLEGWLASIELAGWKAAAAWLQASHLPCSALRCRSSYSTSLQTRPSEERGEEERVEAIDK